MEVFAALLALAPIFLALSLLGGCAREASRETPPSCCPCEESNARPVDHTLMAWLY
jgi:hypothetical protein